MVALATGLVVLAGACSNSADHRLIVADNPAQDARSVRLWAVDPGDELSSDSLVAKEAVQPLAITTLEPDGQVWANQTGVAWKGRALMAYAGLTDDSSRPVLTVGRPGYEPTEVASADAQLQAAILRRGVAVFTDEGCSLATKPEEATEIGKGGCAISEDERWVVSWERGDQGEGGDLQIRDLRKDATRSVKGSFTQATVLGHGSTALAVEADGQGVHGKLIDLTDGSTIATTDVYSALQPMSPMEGADAQVAVAEDGTTSRLLWIEDDGTITTVDEGPFLTPVLVDGSLTYLRLDEDDSKDSIRHWSPGDDEPETLLSGRVGAGSTGHGLIATRDTSQGVELYRSAGSGELERTFTLRTDVGTGGSVVDAVQVQGHTAFLTIATEGGSSFVRLDLTGDHSDAPLRDRQQLSLDSIDTDGTALLTSPNDEGRTDLLVIRPSDDEPAVRATSDSTGLALIHEGVVYWTAVTGEDLAVRSVRATGDEDEEVLYAGHQVAGSLWPQYNGATTARVVSRAAVLQSQAQSGGAAQSGAAAG